MPIVERVATLSVAGNLALATAALLAASPASAQRFQMDLGGTRITFDSAAALGTISLTPLLEWQSTSLYATLIGSLVGFEGPEWGAQGLADVSILGSPFGRRSRWRTELVGTAAATHHSTGFRTLSGRAEARAHLIGDRVGGWVGAATGFGTSTGDSAVAGAAGPTTGAWIRAGSTRASVRLTPLRVRGGWYTEVDGNLSATPGRFDVVLFAGWRVAPEGGVVPGGGWIGGTAAWWVTPRIAVVGGAGTYPADLLEALPGGRYVSVGVRFASRRPSVPVVRPLGRPVYEREGSDGTLRFPVPRATRVEIAGDWNDWRRTPLERDADGRWILRVRLRPGVYRFNLIVDGDRWIVPEGVPAVDDGFGGKTGILIVP